MECRQIDVHSFGSHLDFWVQASYCGYWDGTIKKIEEEFLPAPGYQKYSLCAFFLSPARASYIDNCSLEALSLAFIHS